MTIQRTPEALHIELLSDATFSRGEGTAGQVDIEIEHDELGIPFVSGKTVRGLLRDSWLSMRNRFEDLREAGERVFGPARRFDDKCCLRIGDAHPEPAVRDWLEAAATRTNDPLSPAIMLNACTDIRRQTAQERTTGAPAEATLRSSRVLLRGFVLVSPLTWIDARSVTSLDLAALALAVLATRHGGLLRNRGRGHMALTLDGDSSLTVSLLQPLVAQEAS